MAEKNRESTGNSPKAHIGIGDAPERLAIAMGGLMLQSSSEMALGVNLSARSSGKGSGCSEEGVGGAYIWAGGSLISKSKRI